ncbi:MAG: hypothetical protein M0P12_12635 [Paludibacteraceae bacterium]|nr:hypothetical protein [Paludibacteraceae bacterium]
MMKKILIAVMIILIQTAKAEDYDYGFDLEAGCDFRSSWQLGIDLRYCFLDNLMVKGGFRFQEVPEHSLSRHEKNIEWEIEDADLVNYLFPLSISYEIPLNKEKKESNDFWALFIKPGVIFQPFAADRFTAKITDYQSKKSWHEYYHQNFEWMRLFWSCKAGVVYKTGNDFDIYCGYEINNQDSYAKRRDSEIKGFHFKDHICKEKSAYHYLFLGFVIYY